MRNRLTLLFTLFIINNIVLGQEKKMDLSDNFPRATPSLKEVKNLDVKEADWMVVYENDLVYTNRDGLDLHLQILSPKTEEVLPCIIYIQGSAWMKQNVYMGIPQLSKFAARGYVIVSVEYRHTAIAPFPAQVEDAKTAIRYVRKNASKLKIDQDNIFIWGDSSGGHTAVFAGITSGNKNFDTDDYNDYSDTVNAIVDFYGPTDIGEMKEEASIFNHSDENSPEGLLIGKLNVSENMEKAKEASPINYITMEQSIPPILIAHGDMDRVVPFMQSDILARTLKENNKEFEYYCLKDADHGTPEFWSKAMYDVVDDFLKKNLK